MHQAARRWTTLARRTGVAPPLEAEALEPRRHAEQLPPRTASGGSILRCAARAGLAVALGMVSCSPSVTERTPRPSLLEPNRALAPERSSSALGWRYHPQRPARLERVYALGEGKRLFVGAAGERWVTDAKRGRAMPAPMLAPEPLVGALRGEGAPWVFIGQSGTTYEAESPAGSLLSASAPPVDLAEVVTGEEAIIAVSREALLWLSDDAGVSWRQVGPPEGRFSDVLLDPPHALALEVPERLWWSSDEGRSWQALQHEAFGARNFSRDAAAGPVAVSVLGVRRVAFAGSGPELTPLGRLLQPAEHDLGVPPELGPSARALGRGRAFVSAGRYYEIVLGAKAERLAGPLLGALERHPSPLFSPCRDIQVAGFERWVYAACTRESSGTARQFELFRSQDGGASFAREPYALRGDPELVRLAVGAEGALLASGFCAPGETAAGCQPLGIWRREQSTGAQPRLLPVAAPALEEHARAIAVSADGRTAYAVGARTKSDALFVFVTTDLERGFVARPITLLQGANFRGPAEVVAFAASAEGPLSLVLAHPSGAQRLVLIDADGRTLSVNPAPVDAATLGAHGTRALAVSPEGIWESLNGGAEWELLGRLPPALCAASAGRCTLSVRCEAEGCTLGDSLTRVGWRGSEPPSALPPPRAARPRTSPRRALGPAFSCELSDAEWTELRGVQRLPDATQAALGDAAWFALATDDVTASAGLWIGEVSPSPLDHRGRVRYSELLGASPRAADVAYQATLQVEGAAALRYRLPHAGGGAEASLVNIEVAWENLLDGQRRRAVLPDAGRALPGDFVKGDGVARRAQPDLLSIASGGIFVRVHRQPRHDQVSHFLDGKSVQPVPALRWPLPAPQDARLEMARLDGESVHLAFVDQGATVVRARHGGTGWQLDAMAVGPHDADRFALDHRRDIAYLDGRASLHLTTRRADGFSMGQLFPLQAEGPVLGAPIETPTQADLGSSPPTCGREQRTSTPRVIAPFQPGLRRPLIVHDAVEPVRVLLTDAAVLHGTKGSPCAEVFDAELVRTRAGSGAARERALLSWSGPSWLFRVAPDSSRRDARVEYRTMNCRPDAGVEVPAEVYEMAGTSVRD